MFKSESIKSDPLKVGTDIINFIDGGGHLWQFFFCLCWTGLRLRFSIVSVLRAGITDVGHQRLLRRQYFAQSFPDVSGIIIKVDRGLSSFYIFESVDTLVSSTSLFYPNFSEVFGYVKSS